MSTTSELDSLARIINERRKRVLNRRDSIRLLLRIVFLAVIGWVLFTKVFYINQVNGNAMFPAMKDGDLVIGFRLQQEYDKNNCVVYTVDGVNYVGRIVARQTDVVTLDDSGTLSVNGTTQSGEILYPTYAKEKLIYPYEVPHDCIFVLGDYRIQAKDSRDFGAIPMENVQGKVITILRRRGL